MVVSWTWREAALQVLLRVGTHLEDVEEARFLAAALAVVAVLGAALQHVRNVQGVPPPCRLVSTNPASGRARVVVVRRSARFTTYSGVARTLSKASARSSSSASSCPAARPRGRGAQCESDGCEFACASAPRLSAARGGKQQQSGGKRCVDGPGRAPPLSALPAVPNRPQQWWQCTAVAVASQPAQAQVYLLFSFKIFYEFL